MGIDYFQFKYVLTLANESCKSDNSRSMVPRGPRKNLKDERASITFPFIKRKVGLSGIKTIKTKYMNGIIPQIVVSICTSSH